MNKKLNLLLSAACGVAIGLAVGYVLAVCLLVEVDQLDPSKGLTDQQGTVTYRQFMCGGAIVTAMMFMLIAHAVNKLIAAMSTQ